MVILTPGFKKTKGNSAFCIESNLRSCSTADLTLGFRIVYRVIVRYIPGVSADPATLANQIREAFMNIFGLDDKHVNIEEPVMCNLDTWSSPCWEVYWDKGYLDLRKIHICDVALNSIAKRNQVVIEHIGTTVMARELSYLQKIDLQL